MTALEILEMYNSAPRQPLRMSLLLTDVGDVGEPTGLLYADGTPMHYGDIVAIEKEWEEDYFGRHHHSVDESIIIKHPHTGLPRVMSFCETPMLHMKISLTNPAKYRTMGEYINGIEIY